MSLKKVGLVIDTNAGYIGATVAVPSQKNYNGELATKSSTAGIGKFGGCNGTTIDSDPAEDNYKKNNYNHRDDSYGSILVRNTPRWNIDEGDEWAVCPYQRYFARAAGETVPDKWRTKVAARLDFAERKQQEKIERPLYELDKMIYNGNQNTNARNIICAGDVEEETNAETPSTASDRNTPQTGEIENALGGRQREGIQAYQNHHTEQDRDQDRDQDHNQAADQTHGGGGDGKEDEDDPLSAPDTSPRAPNHAVPSSTEILLRLRAFAAKHNISFSGVTNSTNASSANKFRAAGLAITTDTHSTVCIT